VIGVLLRIFNTVIFINFIADLLQRMAGLCGQRRRGSWKILCTATSYASATGGNNRWKVQAQISGSKIVGIAILT